MASGDTAYTSYLYKSTIHHSYAETTLYAGLDGRSVRRVWDGQTDTYLYDVANFGGGTSVPYPSIPDVNAAADNIVVTTGLHDSRFPATHLEKTTSVRYLRKRAGRDRLRAAISAGGRL